MLVYLNGSFLPIGDATISALDRGFVFGDGVYEVWRVLRGQLFEGERHQARLERGMHALRITPPPDARWERIVAIAERLFDENALHEGEATLYVEITRGAAQRTHYFPPKDTPPTMLVMASAFTPSAARFTGTKVITQPDVRWLKCDIKTIQLLPNVLARQSATEAGASEAIFVRDGVVTEGTHTSVFGILGGALRTHPANHLVLPGITREVVIEIGRELGMAIREEAIAVPDLPRASELFLAGTTTDVTPVLEVDGQAIGDGTPGRITGMLRDRLLARMSSVSDMLASSRR